MDHQLDPKKVARAKQLYIQRGCSEEEAEAKAIKHIGRPRTAAKAHGKRHTLAVKLKGFMRKLFSEGFESLTAAVAYDHLVEHHDYKAKDAKGIGDLFGRHGMCLESGGKVEGKKAYRIPDPNHYPDWYESEVLEAPAEYYSEAAFDELIELEAGAKKSRLLS